MKFQATPLAGLWIVEPEPIADQRGWFARTYDVEVFAQHGLNIHWPQWSTSSNRKAGTVRGMHYQRPPKGEIKLVACAQGAIFDVVVDLRPGSPTRFQVFGMRLDSATGLALYIPDGLAHGFQTLEDDTLVSYHIGTPFAADAAAGLRWNDPAITLEWPLPISAISDKDCTWPDYRTES